MAVRLAFSGGVESLYLAQMFLENKKKVELYYGNIRGAFADPIEAGLVYRCFLKLRELYGNKVDLFYCTQKYFTSSQSQKLDDSHYVNQAFRVACMLTDMMAYGGDHIYACGWTGSGAIEESLNTACYTRADYQAMTLLPRMLHPFSRAYSFPHTILTPLHNQSKVEIFNKLNPELLDYLVLNSDNGRVTTAKIEEYEEANLPLPQYLLGRNIPKEICHNEFARFFFSDVEWRTYFGDDSYEINMLLENSRPFNPRFQARMPVEDVLTAVRTFEHQTKKIITLINLGKGANTNADQNSKKHD